LITIVVFSVIVEGVLSTKIYSDFTPDPSMINVFRAMWYCGALILLAYQNWPTKTDVFKIVDTQEIPGYFDKEKMEKHETQTAVTVVPRIRGCKPDDWLLLPPGFNASIGDDIKIKYYPYGFLNPVFVAVREGFKRSA
jgi:hypothetical protein